MSYQFAVLLAAAGKSRRFAETSAQKASDMSATKKIFADLCGQPVWQHSAALFAENDRVRQIIVIVSPEDRGFFEVTYARQIKDWSLELVDGGAERFESIENGLQQVRSEIDFVAIHDAARPCVRAEQINAVFSVAEQFDAAILASPLVGTIKRVRHADVPDIVETVPRDDLWEAQTPQVFRRSLIAEAFAKRRGQLVTDDAQLVENLGHAVKIVPSDRTNIKITTASDLAIAERILLCRK